MPEYGRRRMLSCVTRCITESDWLRPAADGLAVGHGGRPPSEVRASLWDTAAATWCMACCIPSYWLRPAGDGPCGTRQRRPGAPPAILPGVLPGRVQIQGARTGGRGKERGGGRGREQAREGGRQAGRQGGRGREGLGEGGGLHRKVTRMGFTPKGDSDCAAAWQAGSPARARAER